jgi:hypothetical protein
MQKTKNFVCRTEPKFLLETSAAIPTQIWGWCRAPQQRIHCHMDSFCEEFHFLLKWHAFLYGQIGASLT